MNVYTIPLNFELPLFNTNLSPIEYLKSLPIWANNIKTNPGLAKHFKLNWQTQLSSQLNQFFLDHGQKITWCEVFYKEPNIVSKIHTDCGQIGDFSKINWVFGGEDSEMHWYTVKDTIHVETRNQDPVRYPLGFYTILYQLEDVNLEYSENIRGPVLIQVGTPHNITTGNQERWCLSIVFHDPNLNRRPTMLEAKEIFKQYLP
jgi:hypothetical protein